MPLTMGLSIDKDEKALSARQADKRGYIDSDVPLLESFGILVKGSAPEDFPLSPEDYRTFINWLLGGTTKSAPSIVLRILCYYR